MRKQPRGLPTESTKDEAGRRTDSASVLLRATRSNGGGAPRWPELKVGAKCASGVMHSGIRTFGACQKSAIGSGHRFFSFSDSEMADTTFVPQSGW